VTIDAGMGAGSLIGDLQPIGQLPPEVAIEKLREIGEDAIADGWSGTATTEAFGTGRGFFRSDPVWRHTSHVFGYIEPGTASLIDIVPAQSVVGDGKLAGQQVKITLDRLRIADYPGRGMHRILFDFFAHNQTDVGTEPVHFNAAYRVAEGDHAPVVGRPIFTDLQVGPEGVFLQCVTVNVLNESDESLIAFLDGDAFSTGLKLLTSAQPVIAPFSAMATSLTKAIAARNRNVTVQAVDLGLDFSTVSSRPKLAEGSYIAVQMPESIASVWAWSDWVFDRSRGTITSRVDASVHIPYNYFVIGISRSGSS
jgi:hypothetical protein